MNVEELMTRDVATCRPGDALSHAAQLMWDRDCGCVPVVDDAGVPLAMITDRDVCMAALTQGRPLTQIPVSTAMSQRIVTCAPSDEVTTAESIMRSSQVRRLPVTDARGVLVGVLSLNDIATHGHLGRRLQSKKDDLGADAIATTLSAICAKPASIAHAGSA